MPRQADDAIAALRRASQISPPRTATTICRSPMRGRACWRAADDRKLPARCRERTRARDPEGGSAGQRIIIESRSSAAGCRRDRRVEGRDRDAHRCARTGVAAFANHLQVAEIDKDLGYAWPRRSIRRSRGALSQRARSKKPRSAATARRSPARQLAPCRDGAQGRDAVARSGALAMLQAGIGPLDLADVQMQLGYALAATDGAVVPRGARIHEAEDRQARDETDRSSRVSAR
jgi:hypothetical protein